jgi:hypothetical protein
MQECFREFRWRSVVELAKRMRLDEQFYSNTAAIEITFEEFSQKRKRFPARLINAV